MSRLRYNGLATGSSGSITALSLGGSLTSSATSVTFSAALTYNNGTAVPTITSPDYIPLSILDSNGNLSEIVYLTAYTAAATTGTITRGQEGTTGVAHSSGDKIVHGPNVADIGVNKDPRWTALSGQTTVDEFNDASLDSAWVRVDGTGAASGNLTWTENGDALSASQAGGDTAGKLHGLVRPLSGAGGSMVAGDAFVTCLTLMTSNGSSECTLVGLVLTDNAAFGSGTQVIGEVGLFSVPGLQSYAWTGYGTAGSSVGNLGTGYPICGVPLYIRLVMTASNTWRTDFSYDGISWLKGLATLSLTLTPTHVGFVDSSYGAATKHVASWEFLRRVSGVS